MTDAILIVVQYALTLLVCGVVVAFAVKAIAKGRY